MPTKVEDLLDLKALTARSPCLTERLLVYWRQTNPNHFRDRCVVKVGRLCFFDVAAVEAWIDEHRQAPAGAADRSASEAVPAEAP